MSDPVSKLMVTGKIEKKSWRLPTYLLVQIARCLIVCYWGYLSISALNSNTKVGKVPDPESRIIPPGARPRMIRASVTARMCRQSAIPGHDLWKTEIKLQTNHSLTYIYSHSAHHTKTITSPSDNTRHHVGEQAYRERTCDADHVPRHD